MTSAIKVAKSTKNALTATDPNDFIFHSDFNTFKIITAGLYEPSIPANSAVADYTVAHNLEYVPLIIAFMREGTNNSVVLASNFDPAGKLQFENVGADYTNLIFRIANTDATNAITAHIRYFLFEVPL